ncbi:MAG: hypothetical protein HS115_12310 [Spirochaetales bacterium]|nr:hypothetical protein [Spirochaetales bacterium]
MKCWKPFVPGGKSKLPLLLTALLLMPQCLGVMMATEEQWKEVEKRDPVKQALVAYGLRGSTGEPNRGPEKFTADIFYQEVAALCNPVPCFHPDTEPNPLFKSSDRERDAADAYKTELLARKDLPVTDDSELTLPDPEAPVQMTEEAFVGKKALIKDLEFAASLYSNQYGDLSTYEISRLILLDIQHAIRGARTRRNYELKRGYTDTIGHLARLDVLIDYNREKELVDPLWLEAEKLAIIQIRREHLRELITRNVWKNRTDIDNYLRLFPEYFADGEGQL